MFDIFKIYWCDDCLKVVIIDYDFGDFEVECWIFELIGVDVIGFQSKCEEDFFEVVFDCVVMIN